MALVGTRRPKLPEYDAKRYLKLTSECMERTPSTSPSLFFASPKFNLQQCKYLADKLKSTFKHAESFLKLLNRGYFRFLSSEDKASSLEVFKLLYGLATAVEHFIQTCCKDAWIQAAVFLTNVSEHVSSIGFDLELCALVFLDTKEMRGRGSLTLPEVDEIFKAEVEFVQKKAAQDMEALLGKLKERISSRKSLSTEYELAALLHERLEKSSPKTLESQMSSHSLSDTVRKSLEQNLEKLGAGPQCEVFKANWLGVEVAKKTFYEPYFPEFKKEVSIFVGLSHPNIMPFLHFAKGKRECSIVMELMDEDLFSLIQRRTKTRKFPFGILEAVDIMLQVGSGVHYLHEKKIVHRDLKSKNVLVRCLKAKESRTGIEYIVAKVADFGVSKRKENSMTYSDLTVNMGTTRWMAPELIESSNVESSDEMIEEGVDAMTAKYPLRPDVHSFAMVCYEILTGKLPYSEVSNSKEIKTKILIGDRPELPRHCPLLLKRLIESCWSPHAIERPSFPEICVVLRHLKSFLLLPCNNMVDTGKEPAVQEPLSTEVQPSSWFRSKVSKIQQLESLSWQYNISTASATTSGPSPNTEEASDDNNQEAASTSGASDFMPVHDTEKLPFKYVISLDFGTTFSGFAYARVSDDPEIKVCYEWPTRSSAENQYCKTLTGLYYKRPRPDYIECASWGHLAQSDHMDRRINQHGPGIYLTKFKMLLKKDLNDPALVNSIPPPLTLDTIISDYLKCIGEHALWFVRHEEKDVMLSSWDSVQWCVTVPSIWDESAKQKMRDCMVRASLASVGPSSIDAVKIVLEPEAASFHCHQILGATRKDVSLNVNDKILVADVGGGTVDIVVQELVGNSQNFQVKELTESSGGLCGGTFIDDSFMRFLSKKIGCLDKFLRNDYPPYKTRLLKDCEEIKCAFGHEMMSDTDTKEINLHPKLAQKWEDYEKERGNVLEDSTVVQLTNQELKSIFDPVVNQILELIDAQLTQVPDVKVMFVVGGFAGSPYLLKRIQVHFESKVPHIVSPPNPGSAIVQGAVALALHPDAIVSRISKKTYGTSVVLPFDPKVDPSELLKVTNGVEYCRNRFDVFVKKGSPVEVNTSVTKKYQPHGHGQPRMLFDLYSSTEQDPRYTEGATLSNEGGFAITLPEYDSRDRPEVDLTMFFGRSSIELRANAQFKDGSGQIAETLTLPVEYYN